MKGETKSNFEKFTLAWHEQAKDTWAQHSFSERMLESYRRICTVSAWRSELLVEVWPEEAVEFFLEAQNDFLTSHMLVQTGAVRSALVSLRSAVEQVLHGIYFADHRVEYRRWEKGGIRLSPSELFEYLEKHPDFDGVGKQESGVEGLKQEYATLSRAVHASAKQFRMTNNVSATFVIDPTEAKIGAWATRERHAILGINKILVCLYKQHLEGLKKTNLRRSMSFVFSEEARKKIKEQTGVVVPKPQ